MQVFRLAGRKAEARCCQAGKLVGRQTGRQVGRQTGMNVEIQTGRVGRQEDRQEGRRGKQIGSREAGRQSDREFTNWKVSRKETYQLYILSYLRRESINDLVHEIKNRLVGYIKIR